MAFLDGARKRGCGSNQSSLQRITCINLESEARPAPASRRRAWQERFAEEARAAAAAGSLASDGSSLIRGREPSERQGEHW